MAKLMDCKNSTDSVMVKQTGLLMLTAKLTAILTARSTGSPMAIRMDLLMLTAKPMGLLMG